MKHLLILSVTACLAVSLNSTVFAGEHGGKGGKKNKIGKMFENTDVNQDGQLELSEFLAHAEQRFRAMDLNEDGYVTEEEGRQAHRQMREKRKEARKEWREKRQSEADVSS